MLTQTALRMASRTLLDRRRFGLGAAASLVGVKALAQGGAAGLSAAPTKVVLLGTKGGPRVGGTRSLTVEGEHHQRVGGLAALGAGAVHIQAAGAVVIEGADITLRGPGGFVRIDGGGVTIDGGAVNIQKGGAPGEGAGASPLVPLVPGRADQRGPGPRRLPLFGFPGLPPMQVGLGRPPTPEETILCRFICQCKNTKFKQVCVTQKVRELDKGLGGRSKLKAEVPYDMTKTPPTPIMSNNEPGRPSTGSPPDSRKPDVVVVHDPSKPPTNDNLERVVEIKFPGDRFRRDQRPAYQKIAHGKPLVELSPETCACDDDKPRKRPARVEDVALEVGLLALLLLALALGLRPSLLISRFEHLSME